MSEPIIEPAKLPNSSNMFPSHKLQHKFLTFEFLGLKAKCLFQSTEFINQKFQVKIHESTASIERLKHMNRNQTTHTWFKQYHSTRKPLWKPETMKKNEKTQNFHSTSENIISHDPVVDIQNAS